MWFSRLFRKAKEAAEAHGAESAMDQGIFYMYLIIVVQIVFVLGLAAVVMVVGKVLATPTWVFLLAIALGVGGLVYIFRKARHQFRKLREALKKVDLSNRNYQITVMGGMLTMRVEQNQQHLLESSPSNPPLIEAEPIDTTATH